MADLQLITERIAEESGMTQYVAANNKSLDRFAEAIVRDCALTIFHLIGPKSALNVLEHYGLSEHE